MQQRPEIGTNQNISIQQVHLTLEQIDDLEEDVLLDLRYQQE